MQTSLPSASGPQAHSLDKDDAYFAHSHQQNLSNSPGIQTTVNAAPLPSEPPFALKSRNDNAAAAVPVPPSPVVEDDASEGLVDSDGHGEDAPDLERLMSELTHPTSGVELLSDLHQPPSDEELQAQQRHQELLASDAKQSRLFRDHHAGLWTGKKSRHSALRWLRM